MSHFYLLFCGLSVLSCRYQVFHLLFRLPTKRQLRHNFETPPKDRLRPSTPVSQMLIAISVCICVSFVLWLLCARPRPLLLPILYRAKNLKHPSGICFSSISQNSFKIYNILRQKFFSNFLAKILKNSKFSSKMSFNFSAMQVRIRNTPLKII